MNLRVLQILRAFLFTNDFIDGWWADKYKIFRISKATISKRIPTIRQILSLLHKSPPTPATHCDCHHWHCQCLVITGIVNVSSSHHLAPGQHSPDWQERVRWWANSESRGKTDAATMGLHTALQSPPTPPLTPLTQGAGARTWFYPRCRAGRRWWHCSARGDTRCSSVTNGRPKALTGSLDSHTKCQKLGCYMVWWQNCYRNENSFHPIFQLLHHAHAMIIILLQLNGLFMFLIHLQRHGS